MLAVADRTGMGRADKPQTAVQGQACRMPWAWNGLCFGVAFHEASLLGIRDIVNNVAPSTVSGLAWTTDSYGNPAANLGLSSYLYWPDSPVHDRPSTEVTAAVRLKRSGTPEDWGTIFGNYYGASAPYQTWSIGQHSTNVGKVCSIISTAGVDHLSGASATALPTTEYVNVFLRWRTGVTSEISVFGERGNWLHTTVGVIASGSLSYAASMGVRMNATDGTTENFGGHYSQAMVWSRMLTDTEIRWLCLDPFGWYAPRRESVAVAGPFPIFGMAGPGMTYVGPSN